jgi:TolB-like protein
LLFLFADHTLDTDRRELLRGSEPVAVEPQVFDLVIYLLANRDRVVSKDDLIAAVWGGRVVSDSTLASRINAARKAVGDNGAQQRLIRTIARKGIRFVGAVRTQSSGAAAPPPDVIALSLPDRPAIAVLPFINMSGDPDQEYFADGLTEDIITGLSRQHWFFVIARNSTFTYKGRSVDVREVAAQLGVRYILKGSVRKAANRVRVTSQLIDVTNSSHLWAEKYDRELTDIFCASG